MAWAAVAAERAGAGSAVGVANRAQDDPAGDRAGFPETPTGGTRSRPYTLLGISVCAFPAEAG